MRRILTPLIFGLGGAAMLIALGIWQVQRMTWKEAVLADITAHISADPVALPARPDPQTHRYLPVRVTGTLSGPELHLLVSRKQIGAGYRIVQAFETGGRRIMVDRGFIALTDKDKPRTQAKMSLTGNLHWPDEIDGFTPAPDIAKNIWFARDVPAMARALDTEPVLLVISRNNAQADAAITPLPVDTASIPNDHLNYAITWFSLALIWLGMTGYYLWRQAAVLKGTRT